MPHHNTADEPRACAPPCSGRRRVTIISASVGAGHDGAADELGARLEAAAFTVDRLDFLDLLPARLGRILSRLYHRTLMLAPAGYQRVYAALERAERPGLPLRLLLRSAESRTLAAITSDTVAVVSTYPGASQVLGALRQRRLLDVPTLTYLTDFSVHPLWVAPGVDAHLAVHPIPAQQARGRGATRVAVTGPAVGSRFSPATENEQRALRARFSLPDGVALALLVAGSWGVGALRRSAAEIRQTGAAMPVVVCGRNETLAARLRADGFAHVHGWVDDMPSLMRACDVLVQNAGGLTSLEAFASGLPVISYRCIPGHGRTNAAALDEARLAPWVREAENLAPALADVLSGPIADRRRVAGLALNAPPQDVVTVIAATVSSNDIRTASAPHALPAPTAARRLGLAGHGSPTVRRSSQPRARSRSRTMAGALVATVCLGIAIPLAGAYDSGPSRFSSFAHELLERYEL